jgi:hypothetical protein
MSTPEHEHAQTSPGNETTEPKRDSAGGSQKDQGSEVEPHETDEEQDSAEESWGSYNSASPGPSNLPPVSPLLLLLFATGLALLLTILIASSLRLAVVRDNELPTQHRAQSTTIERN